MMQTWRVNGYPVLQFGKVPLAHHAVFQTEIFSGALRIVPAHMNELRGIGWNAKTDELPNGVKLTVTANEAQPLTKLKALGFIGIIVQRGHHQPHHLLMAMGQFVH